MENFKFYKEIKSSDPKLIEAFPRLEKLYRKLPETKGCLENLKECDAWCCFFQNPQILYVEFLYIWKNILNKLESEEISDIIRSSMINYITGFTTKGCVLFHKYEKICRVHGERPYNCYIYGITPEKEFEPRYERMKEMYKDDIGAVIKDQCDLISTCKGKKITVEDTNRWWKQLVEIEKFIGVKEENINDDVGGSYRTFHDHLLLYLMPDDVLEDLQILRISNDEEKGMAVVEQFISYFKNKLKDGRTKK